MFIVVKAVTDGLISLDRLKVLLNYDPTTGDWRWRFPRKGVKRGAQPGNISVNSRNRIFVDGRSYLAARLAYFYMTGVWSKLDVDHINGNTLDDRFENLRLATRSQNLANRRVRRNGLKGVVQNPTGWQAKLQIGYKRIHLGQFSTEEEAHEAYVAAAKQHHGAFAREK